MSIESLKQAMRRADCAALILSEENIRYFTGFSSTNGILYVYADKALFFTDGRFIEAAKNKIKSCDDVLLLESFEKSVLPIIQHDAPPSVSFEAARLTVSNAERIRKALGAIEWKGDLLDCEINRIRMIKTAQEVEKIEKAQRIAERALELLKPQILPGKTERELALELDYTMLRMGAEALSFETIFVSGKNTSLPHGVPSDKKLARGDFITIDFGAVFCGYHSDMTRTFALCEANDRMKKIYDTVLRAQNAGLAALMPKKSCKEIDGVSRAVIADAGYGEYFTHSLGHGVGVEIHEEPRLSQLSDQILEVGNVVTVEPGIYLPGDCGVRIEDMALITESGARNLTACPKEFEILNAD